MDVALATAATLPGLDQDDHVLLDILARRGLNVAPVVWDAPNEDWSAHKLCVVRSCWDYPVRRDDFVAWTQRVESVTCLWNSAKIVEWNTHKNYLHDLQQRGITVVPTVILNRGELVSLDEIMTDQQWENIVKRADDGQFRVQKEFGGVVEWERPNAAVTAFVGRVLESVPFRADVRYGRIDLVEAEDGTLMVSELELIEPEWYFKYSSECAERFADLIERKLS